MFNIDDPTGEIQSRFHSLVGSRFRSFKARLVKDYLQPLIDELEAGTPSLETPTAEEGALMVISTDDSKKKKKVYRDPWIRYAGSITQEQWETFKASRLEPSALVINDLYFDLFVIIDYKYFYLLKSNAYVSC